MRLAETENCCASHNAKSCILPLEGPAVHTKQEGSKNAMALLKEVLDDTKPKIPTHLKAQWFINMTAMTLGGYPDLVPEAYRIPPKYFEGKEKFPHFENVAPKLGLDVSNLAGGVIADDFDNDDDIDLLLTNYARTALGTPARATAFTRRTSAQSPSVPQKPQRSGHST
jgi:hypothetical protein